MRVLLPHVGHPAEDQHAHDHHQHQQPQFFVTAKHYISNDSIFITYLCCSVSPKVLSPVMCLASLKILSILMIRNIWAILLISDWYFVCLSFSVPVTVTRDNTKDMKYGRIPRRSITFMTPFTNLEQAFNIFGLFVSCILTRTYAALL